MEKDISLIEKTINYCNANIKAKAYGELFIHFVCGMCCTQLFSDIFGIKAVSACAYRVECVSLSPEPRQGDAGVTHTKVYEVDVWKQ